MLGSDECIKLVISDGKVFGALPENVYVITLGFDVGTDIGSLDRYVDGSNFGKLEVFLIGDSLVYTGGNVLGYDEGINWEYLMV